MTYTKCAVSDHLFIVFISKDIQNRIRLYSYTESKARRNPCSEWPCSFGTMYNLKSSITGLEIQFNYKPLERKR